MKRWQLNGKDGTDSDCTPSQDANEKALAARDNGANVTAGIRLGAEDKDELSWTTEPNDPGIANWVLGDYTGAIEVSVAETSNLVYKIELRRVTSACAVGEVLGTSGSLSGTGAKVFTVNVDPAAGAAGDRLQMAILCTLVIGMHGDVGTLTIVVEDVDSYLEGPLGAEAAADAIAGPSTTDAVAVVNRQAAADAIAGPSTTTAAATSRGQAVADAIAGPSTLDAVAVVRRQAAADAIAGPSTTDAVAVVRRQAVADAIAGPSTTDAVAVVRRQAVADAISGPSTVDATASIGAPPHVLTPDVAVLDLALPSPVLDPIPGRLLRLDLQVDAEPVLNLAVAIQADLELRADVIAAFNLRADRTIDLPLQVEPDLTTGQEA